MDNYDEKILTIKNNYKKLLILAKEKIEEEGKIFSLNTKNIVDVIIHDTKIVKKYEAVVEAEKLLQSYTNELKNAKTIDEIKEIRKKLNNSINKVKKEMINRGFDDIEYNNYLQNVSDFRKKISLNIRFLKREEKIKEIDTLYKNFDSLNEEELLRLKKLVKNEISYGKKYLDNGNNIKRETTDVSNNNIELDKMENILPNRRKYRKPSRINFESFDSLQCFLNNRVDLYSNQYNITKTDEYNGNLIKNISIFTKNLPKLVNNRKKVDKMIRDYNLFCRKPELLGYCNYVDVNNSILRNFKKAVKNGVLKNKENDYEDEHKKIVNWIINFCNNNNLAIKYNKTR